MSKADEDAVLLASDPVADVTSAIGAWTDLFGLPASPLATRTPAWPWWWPQLLEWPRKWWGEPGPAAASWQLCPLVACVSTDPLSGE